MSDFIRVASTSDLTDPGQVLLEVEDKVVVLFFVGGEYFCIDDVCTHDGGPLSEGRLDEYAIACPRHGAKFDIRNGQALTMPATVDTAAHEVKVEGTEIFVRLCEPGYLAKHAPRQLSSKWPVTPKPATPEAAAAPPTTAPTADAPITEALNPMAATGGALTGQISEDLVREELKKVIDPELFINIVDLGLIYNVDLLPATEGKTNCKIDMTMTSPMCPAGPQMIANSKQVLGQINGMGEVEVKIVLDPPWTPDKMTQEARDHLGIF